MRWELVIRAVLAALGAAAGMGTYGAIQGEVQSQPLADARFNGAMIAFNECVKDKEVERDAKRHLVAKLEACREECNAP